MINVKLLAGTHSVYNELINFPPKNINYQLTSFTSDFKVHYEKITIFKRKLVSLFLTIFHLPRIVYLINSNKKNKLIHSCRGILILNRKPWIIDFEHLVACVGYDFRKINDFHYRRIIEKFFNSSYCKAILPWSLAAKKTIFTYLDPSKFKDKIEIIYPAMHKVENFKKEKNEKIRILFVGYSFLAKGGLDLIESFKILNKKYDVELIVITNLPEKYERLKRTPNIKLLPPQPREKIFEYYKNCDIFCLPSYVDSFGFVILEAKAFGLPIVTSDFFALPELIKDNQSGFLINLPERLKRFPFTKNPKKDIEWYLNFINQGKHKNLINQLTEKLKILIEDSKLRKKFGKKGKKEIEKGKFSIKKRNKKLEHIYEKAISDK